MSAAPEGWVPAFEGQRPAFTSDSAHALALKHGAFSERVLGPLVERIVAETLADPESEYLRRSRWAATLQAWAREEARCRLLSDHLDAHGMFTEEGGLRAGEIALHRAETRAANLRRELGLTPLAAARLGRDRAQEVALTDIYVAMDRADRGVGPDGG